MDVKAIRLQNFMAFEDTDWIEFRPITLLFGRNSSGKSVIIRALRLLRQSLSSPVGSPFRYVAEDGVDVGRFVNICHGSDKTPYEKGEKGIRFSFRCAVRKEILNYLRKDIQKDDLWVEYILEFRLLNNKPSLTWVEIRAPWSASTYEERYIILIADLLDVDPDTVTGYNWWFESDFLHAHHYAGIENPWPYVDLVTGVGFLPVVRNKRRVLIQIDESSEKREMTSIEDADLVDEENKDPAFLDTLFFSLNASISNFLKSIEYLQPVRPLPQRIYVADQVRQMHWREQGSWAFLQFLMQRVAQDKIDALSDWLNELDLGVSIEIESLSTSPEEGLISRVYLNEGEPGLYRVSLNDVGFGASQILPVILQSLLAEAGSLVMVEQPELHLHPHAQAKLGDLFIEAISVDGEDQEKDLGRFFLIETHSEHLLLRLRRRIAETFAQTIPFNKLPLSPVDLRIYFVYRASHKNREKQGSIRTDLANEVKKEASTVTEIVINENGSINNTPTGFDEFFSDDLLETIALKKAQLYEFQ